MTHIDNGIGGGEVNKEKIDQTIEAICEHIQSEVKDNPTVTVDTVMAEYIKSLAALITAREHLEITDFRV